MGSWQRLVRGTPDVTAARDQQQLKLLEACVSRLRDCVVIAEVGDQGRPTIVYVNDAFVERTGYTRDEVIGKTHALPMWLELDVTPVEDSNGRVTHWISIERDATSRKTADEELRRSEEQYRLLFANNPLPMWAYDIETLRFCAVNDAAIAHYGYTREQFLSMTIADIRPADDVPALRKAVHGEDVGFGNSGVWRHRAADGRILYVEIASHKMRLDGRPVRIVLAHDVSRELEAIEALRGSEASLARAQRIAHLGSWELVLATDALQWSDEMYRMFGIEPGEVGPTYEAFRAAVHPDDREAMHAAHMAARTGSKLDIEYRIVRPDGSLRWVRELGELECDAANTPIRITAAVLDVTDRNGNEVRHSLGRQLLETITSGRPLDEILDEAVRVLAILEPQFTAAVRLPGGPSLDPLTCALPVTASDGRIVAILELSANEGATCDAARLDIFERMRDLIAIAFERDAGQRELRESEERFRLLATGTNDAVWDYDVTRKRLWWNDGITRLFGVARDELEPALASRTRRIHPEDRERIVTGFANALASDAVTWSDEYRFQRADGTYAFVHDRSHIIRDSAGCAVRVIGGMMDVTERRELERQLLRSQRLDSIGTLAGGIAHDLNNVLQPILFEIEGLREAATVAGRLDELVVVEQCAQRGAALVRQLLSFARGTEVPRASLELAQLGGELKKLIRDTFPKNIDLAMYIAPQLRRVRANATELHQVVLNLCVNARDAMPRGGSLRICFMNAHLSEPPRQHYGTARPGEYVVIEVSDSGSGMAPEVMDRMFEPFFTTKDADRGTGLGLATAHAIVRQHGGFLTVESIVGTGSTFRVFLPATDAQPVPATVQTRAPDGAGETILVVDDEPHIRTATQRVLEEHGYTVRTAANGREAIEIFRSEQIAAVILDLAMPDLDGTATVAALGQIDPTVRIIGASGLPSREFASAVRCFLPKPFTTDQLLSTLASAIFDA